MSLEELIKIYEAKQDGLSRQTVRYLKNLLEIHKIIDKQ